jgi:lambda family phage tail tape measure protein
VLSPFSFRFTKKYSKDFVIMSISLGSIVVDLIAKTGGFVEGMTQASYAAKKSAAEIKGSFADMGAAAQSMLAPFGEIGQKLGAAFGGLGSTMASVTNGLVSIGGAASFAAVGIGAAVGAVSALGVAGAGIALFAAKGAAELYEMSEKTGVSVESLSRLGFAAKQTGVGQDQLAKALERMNKSAFAAATAPEGAKNAYTRLGVSVKDAAGNLKPTSQLFEEVAGKIAGIENPTARGAAAMNIFGRAGAELLPLLNQGSEGIKAMSKEADELGVTISGKTAADSHKFEQTLGEIQGALTGASNAVLKEFLPSLQAFADFIINDLKDPSGIFRSIGQTILTIAVPAFKVLASAIAVLINAADMLWTTFREGVMFATTLVVGLGDAIANIAHGGSFKQAGADLKENFRQGLEAFTKGVADETDKADKRLQDFFASTWFGKDNGASPEKKSRQKTNVDTTPAVKDDAIDKKIQGLAAETEKEAQLANAIRSTSAATIALTAAAQAQQIISDLNISGAQKGISVNEQQASAIQKLTLLLAAYKDALNVNKELDSSIQKIEEETKAAQLMGAAYLQGAGAIEKAKEAAELLPFEKQVTDLHGVYDQLVKTGGGFTDLQSILSKMGPSGKALAEQFRALGIENLSSLRAAITDADEKFKQLKADIPLKVLAEQAEEANKRIKELSDNTDAHIRSLLGENAAILAGGSALKNFNLQVQLQKDFPNEADRQTQAYQDQLAKLKQLDDLELQKSANEKVAAALRYRDLETQIDTLEKLRATFKAGSDEEIAADAVIRQDKLAIIKGQDDLLLSTQSISNGFKAFFNEYSNSAKTAAQDVSDVMNKAFSGIEDNLAKFITGQKTSWRKMVTDIGQEVAKLGIQTALHAATGGLGGGLFGAAGGAAGQKPGTSKSNAIWTRNADGVPGLPAGGSFGSTPVTGSLFHANSTGAGAPAGTAQDPSFITTADSPGSGILAGLGGSGKGGNPIAGLFSSVGSMFGPMGGMAGGLLGDIFGGFRADGGDTTPGKAYMVGERGPEVMMPRTAGTVIPNHALGSGKSTHVSVTNHFHNTQDMDTFKKSSAQIQRDFGRSTQVAMGRR